jgi:uncharacterized membrane protein SirB2
MFKKILFVSGIILFSLMIYFEQISDKIPKNWLLISRTLAIIYCILGLIRLFGAKKQQN